MSDNSPTNLPQPPSLSEVTAAVRARAERILAGVGLSLSDTGHRWAADVLYVSSAERSVLDDPEREALDKATAALGYNPVETTIVTIPELLAAAGEGNLVTEAIAAVVDALNPIAVIYLDARAHEYAPAIDRRTAAVDDFFASLGSQPLKRLAWQQMQSARLEPSFK